MMASQALTNVTALSKRSLNQNEPDSILAASTAIGTLRGRAKMDAMNKSARSGLYSTIGRNAKMPDDDDDEDDNDDDAQQEYVAPLNSRAQSVAASRKSLASNNPLENAKSQMSLAKSAKSSRSVAKSAASQGQHSTVPSGTQFSSNQHSKRSESRDSRSQASGSKSHTSRSRSRTRSRMSEDYTKSNLSISETNLSETNLSMSESQYSQSQYSNSQYSRTRSVSGTRSEYSDEDSYNSRSTIQSRR
jgi:hypothetical protein